MKLFRNLLVAAAAIAPSPLFACAACYGKSDSPLASGMNWGIFTLLGVVVTVLGCFISTIVYLARKEKTAVSVAAATLPAQAQASNL